MSTEVRLLKFALAIVGAAVLAVGIIAAVLVSVTEVNLESRMINECMSNPASATCVQLAASLGIYGLYFWLSIFVGVIGVVLLIVGLVLGTVTSGPQMPTAPYPVQPVPPPVPAAAPPCPRCGRPLRWVAQYNRWFCDVEQTYV
jgi:hypothetical protein